MGGGGGNFNKRRKPKTIASSEQEVLTAVYTLWHTGQGKVRWIGVPSVRWINVEEQKKTKLKMCIVRAIPQSKKGESNFGREKIDYIGFGSGSKQMPMAAK